jgi:type IV secretory pathway VirD2 relaxase
LVVDKNTGYFNATKLCKDGNKDFSDWKCLKKSNELIKFYKSSSPQNSAFYFKCSRIVNDYEKNYSQS